MASVRFPQLTARKMSAPLISRWGFATTAGPQGEAGAPHKPPGPGDGDSGDGDDGSGPSSVLFRLESRGGGHALAFALTLVGADALADGSRPVWRADFTMKQLENMPVSAWSAQEERERERELMRGEACADTAPPTPPVADQTHTPLLFLLSPPRLHANSG